MAGGDIAAVWAVEMADGRDLVLKQSDDTPAQARMIDAMAAAGAPVPAIIARGGDAVLMERVEAGGLLSDAWNDLAAALTALHRPCGEKYGWEEDHAFSHVAVPNGRHEDWAAFWRDCRLLPSVPHIDARLARRIERLCARIGDILPATPAASLLHGDLWGGNVLCAGSRVTGLIDPSCYYGDREVDWAMLTLFDRPPERFYAAMEPLPGWEQRLPCYRLWPLLIHVRLFGASYHAPLENDLAALGF